MFCTRQAKRKTCFNRLNDLVAVSPSFEIHNCQSRASFWKNSFGNAGNEYVGRVASSIRCETFAISRDILGQSLPSKFHETAESHWPLFSKAPWHFFLGGNRSPTLPGDLTSLRLPILLYDARFPEGFEQFYTELVVILAKNYSRVDFQGITANFIPAQ